MFFSLMHKIVIEIMTFMMVIGLAVDIIMA